MNDKFEFPQELIDGFRKIAIMHEAQQRQAMTMLAGFIATNERDIRYMDEYMDPLYDFIEPASDTEEIIRKYINHIANFDPVDAKERANTLEDHLGYKTKIVYAAGLLARRLHAGQKDKGGNDYFSSHLLKVAENGFDWKEKVTGFLHDAAEDCSITVAEVIELLDKEIEKLTNHSNGNLEEEEWWQEWMEEIMPYPAPETHPLSADERAEIIEALNLMNHHTAPTRAEYIERFRGHRLAIKTKLNDLKSNMDLSRIASPTKKDLDRAARYENEQNKLYQMLWSL